MKWYPGDWRADPKLRACEPLSRYVWMEMLGLMHEAEPYGHLVLSGRAMDYKTLSRLIGVEVGEVKRAVKELEDRGVFSRTDGGVIFSRRMIRDENRRKMLIENGKRGGNPLLIKQPLSDGLDNQPHNYPDNTQIPEARKEDSSLRSESPVPDGTGPPARAPPKLEPARVVAERMLAIWRDVLGDTGLPMPRRLEADRIRAAAAAWRERFGGQEERWRAHVQAIRGLPFLLGILPGKTWRATFDWALTKKAVNGIEEGRYGTPEPNGHDPPEGAYSDEDWVLRLGVRRDGGRWVEELWGPPPGAEGCRVPPHLLAMDKPH